MSQFENYWSSARETHGQLVAAVELWVHICISCLSGGFHQGAPSKLGEECRGRFFSLFSRKQCRKTLFSIIGGKMEALFSQRMAVYNSAGRDGGGGDHVLKCSSPSPPEEPDRNPQTPASCGSQRQVTRRPSRQTDVSTT